MLFHEIYGRYYQVTANILKEAVRGNLTRGKLNAMIHSQAFSESILTMPENLVGSRWSLIREDLSTPLKNEPHMPLTILEKRWIKALMLDPRIRLFEPDMEAFSDVEPLFSPDMIVYYDRSAKGDDYSDPLYVSCFKTALAALREHRKLKIRWKSSSSTAAALTSHEAEAIPMYLEYAEKDDIFRITLQDEMNQLTVRISQITECEMTSAAVPPDALKLKKETRESVTIELTDFRNAKERVLSHFSHLEKETKRLDDLRYQITLKYNSSDESEMVTRILSFGPVIKVTSPESFTELIRKRIRAQISMKNCSCDVTHAQK